MHKRKDIWGENANKFDPDNFLPDREKSRPKNAYLPFSFGPRNCIGYKYAIISMRIFIAHLLMHYKFSTRLKLEELKYTYTMTTAIDQGHLVRIKKR